MEEKEKGNNGCCVKATLSRLISVQVRDGVCGVSPHLQVACHMAKMNLRLFSDYNNIKAAYEAMKNVACLINERKRKLESIDKIARWQVSIVGWEVSGYHPHHHIAHHQSHPPPPLI